MATIQHFSEIDLNKLTAYRASWFNSRVKTGCSMNPVKGFRANNLILAMARMVNAEEDNVENSLGKSANIKRIFIKNEEVMNKAKRNVLLGFITRICLENPIYDIDVVSAGISDNIINQKLRLCKSVVDIYEQANRIIDDIYHTSDIVNKDIEISEKNIDCTYNALMNYEYDQEPVLKDFSDEMKDFSDKRNTYNDIISGAEGFVSSNNVNNCNKRIDEIINIMKNADTCIKNLEDVKATYKKLNKARKNTANNIIEREAEYLDKVGAFIANPYTPKYLKKEFSEKYNILNNKIEGIDIVLREILISNIKPDVKRVNHSIKELVKIKNKCEVLIEKYKRK